MNQSFLKIASFTLVSLFYGVALPAGVVHLKIIDEADGKPVPVRVLLRAADGVCRVPEEAPLLEIGRDTWFMSPGSSSIELPAGKTELRVERGKEYLRVKSSFEIEENQSLERVVRLRRWIDMCARGYLSAENHLHLPPKTVGAFCAAEDLNFGTALQWWFRPQFGVPEGSRHIRNLSFGSVTVPTTVFDTELEYQWGALYIVGLPNPCPFLDEPGKPNLAGALYARERGALNCYQGGWSREVLIDALLGLVDVVNVCNNNFHMHRFQPRSRYSNLLNVEELPVYPNTPEGMLSMNLDTYYRLLNCGLKLAAGAGSATGVKDTPAGFNRAYIRCSAGDGVEKMLENWRQGRNFVTNGPMLFLRGSDGQRPGDSLELAGPGTELELEIEAISDYPLRSVEVVVNGEVAASLSLAQEQTHIVQKVTVPITESAWLCARATDLDYLLTDQELAFYNQPPEGLYALANRLRFAHTSPIYVKLAGKGVAVERSLRESLLIIEAFEKFAREKASETYRESILKAANQARNELIRKLEGIE